MPPPLNVLCCYARKDQDMLKLLRTYLYPLQRQGLIDVWSDADLNAGVEWEKVLHQWLENADIFLLLISPDFMASDYCYGKEMQRAIERHEQGSARVIPVLIRTTFWQDTPLATLQMIPSNVQPVTHWPHRDDAFYDIIGQIKLVIGELRMSLPLSNTNADHTMVLGGKRTTGDLLEMRLLYSVSGHKNVSCVAVNADGSLLASAGAYEIKLWNGQTGQPLHTLLSGTDHVSSLAFSADGRILAGGGDLVGDISLWNGQTGQLLHTLPYPRRDGPVEGLWSLAVSADGQVLAGCGKDKTIKLWNGQTGQFLYTLTDQAELYSFIAMSANGRILAHTNYDNTGRTIDVWNIQTRKPLRTLPASQGDISSVAVSADGQLLASCGGDRTIKVWYTENGQLLYMFTNYTGWVWSVAMSADGQLLASGSEDTTIKLWSKETDQLIRTLTEHTSPVKTVAISADGQLLASGSEDGCIKVWAVKR